MPITTAALWQRPDGTPVPENVEIDTPDPQAEGVPLVTVDLPDGYAVAFNLSGLLIAIGQSLVDQDQRRREQEPGES